MSPSIDAGSRLDAQDIEYHDGLHLKDSPLWFDALESRDLCFVSAATIPGARRHEKIITTSQTAELLGALRTAYGAGPRAHEPQVLVTPYGRPFSLGSLNLELFPSGYALGADSLLVERGGRRLVYASYINTRRGGVAERLEARRCDVLILPCSPGLPDRLTLPPEEEVERALVNFVEDAFDERRVPVIFCPLLDAAPRVAHLLSSRHVALRLHRSILAVLRVHHRENAAIDLSRMRRYRGALDVVRRPEALLWPLALRQSPTISRLSRARLAVVSERALVDAYRAELGVENGFALSSHADHAALLDYVRACQPEQVVLTGCDESALGQDLEALGMEVHRVGRRLQLGLFDT